MAVSPLTKLYSGGGSISVSLHGEKAVFSELASTYPLKLLAPCIHDKTALVYLLSYGGGLVGGDEVDLNVNVQRGARLLILSQGTTKVFKTRIGRRQASVHAKGLAPGLASSHHDTTASLTQQNIAFRIAPDSLLLLLPEPVTCFRDASYHQRQTFHIERNGSLVILDWITSGRISRGEEWVFSRYHSTNEVFYDGKRVAKDTMLLENQELGPHIPERPLRERLKPYSCYAMVIFYGPQTRPILTDLASRYDQITIFKEKTPAQLIWSLSSLEAEDQGAIVRVAGLETEIVKNWLKDSLSRLEEAVGRDLYRRAFV
ncbi:hypothetical protein NLJ89_g1856 [Agrocybe chaxingu]|uniref:UreD-domain-containing protein n=1 Tax=Agrocybe chaxingu TaxID=84603 RepID=A0A9W8MZ84_9AGAR|nr:hypothetical protein NLJ89_g1856 [Agrocybe chaxingu]